MSPITIYAAKKIITMNPNQTVASHVAVQEGRILGVGSLQDLAGWGDYKLDQTFAEKILLIYLNFFSLVLNLICQINDLSL